MRGGVPLWMRAGPSRELVFSGFNFRRKLNVQLFVMPNCFNIGIINFCFTSFLLISASCCGYALFAVQNERRHLDSLDGLWTFVREPPNSVGIGLQNHWASLDLALFKNSSQIPVPSAYNDLTADSEQRDHVGWVWYQRKYFLSHFLLEASNRRRSFLRFEGVNYCAIVFVNGKFVTEHRGGHLPFQVEVQLADVNLISVAVNNTLSWDTIPPGNFSAIKLASGRELVSVVPNFDFFNYAGILRSVYLWHLPPIFIRGIRIRTDHLGLFSYRIDVDRNSHPAKNIRICVAIFQFEREKKIYEFIGSQNSTILDGIELWWPKGMGKPTLYTAEVRLESLPSAGRSHYVLLDIYRETFGFRSVTTDQNRIYINGRPFYCHGFGMHEDIGIRGRGFDQAAMVKDLNMFEWLNGNCYRTSHYPYAEQRAHLADRMGIAVITEVPAVGIWNFNSSSLLKLHAEMITEMVARDRNHPSVIMWSLSNEPKLVAGLATYEYFKNLAILTKQLDITRPITIVFGHVSEEVKVATLLDVICVNEYFGWYRNIGMLEVVRDNLVVQIRKWRHRYIAPVIKPVILSEYGAEAISGFNEQPSVPFSEQYQAELIQETGKALDELRCSDDIAGEMLWNFADFMTNPSVSRAIGNHKGILTRERKPKMGAYAIRKRYKTLLENITRANLCPAKIPAAM